MSPEPNALAYAPKGKHSMVSAAIRTAFAQESPAAASTAWRHVADQLRSRFPKFATLMDEAEAEVLTYKAFPAAHWAKLHSTNPPRTAEQGGQATRRRRRHLPQRGQHHKARRRLNSHHFDGRYLAGGLG